MHFVWLMIGKKKQEKDKEKAEEAMLVVKVSSPTLPINVVKEWGSNIGGQSWLTNIAHQRCAKHKERCWWPKVGSPTLPTNVAKHEE